MLMTAAAVEEQELEPHGKPFVWRLGLRRRRVSRRLSRWV
jgi:hypothetical protein